jgi:hypothetical protein
MKVNAKLEVIVRTEVDTSYIPGDDITVVWQLMFVGDELVQRSLVGWYYGEADPAITPQYASLPLTAQYID